jgi:hypothetical protein
MEVAEMPMLDADIFTKVGLMQWAALVFGGRWFLDFALRRTELSHDRFSKLLVFTSAIPVFAFYLVVPSTLRSSYSGTVYALINIPIFAVWVLIWSMAFWKQGPEGLHRSYVSKQKHWKIALLFMLGLLGAWALYYYLHGRTLREGNCSRLMCALGEPLVGHLPTQAPLLWVSGFVNSFAVTMIALRLVLVINRMLRQTPREE